jgi:crotonobetaine/carnitine-CoA ligase
MTSTAPSPDPQATPDVSLLKTLCERAEAGPDEIYVIDVEGRSLSYRQTLDGARLWAAAYRRIGVCAGDHVVTLQHNTIDSLLGWLGLAWIGAIEAPINNDYRGALLTQALNLTETPVMLLMERFLDRVVEVAGDLKRRPRLVVVDGVARAPPPFETTDRESFLANLAPARDLDLPKPWDIMAVLFTSGTTGPSKAVRLPWAQVHATAAGMFPLGDLSPGEVIYNAGPTYHIGAKALPYLAALCGGRHVMRPFRSRTAVGEEYLKYGVTMGGVVHAWLAEPARADDRERPLRNVLTPYRDPAAEAFARRFGCRRFGCFNMTEVSCPISFRDWDAVVYDAADRMSCGVIREGYEARLVDESDQPVKDGETGELIVRAEAPWVLNAGYLNNPEATSQAWRNGWFHTGDAFTRDAEGNYFFVDRLKDCIRRHQENISSFEVEAHVDAHPAVARSAAVAVKRSPAPGADEEIKIVVELVPGVALGAEDLIRWLIPRTPRFMIPRYVEFTDALPLTPNQKVRKAVLRERGLDGVWDREASGVELPRDVGSTKPA